MPLLQHCWHMPWSTEVLCSDACLGGFGAVMGSVTTSQVRAWGSLKERRRFKYKSAGGRARALRLDPWAAPTTEMDPDLDEWEVDTSFPEIDPAALRGVEWRVLCHGPYVHDEPIHILEARAQHSGLLEAHLQGGWAGMRTLTLMDNMSDVLALERARAHNYGLLLQLRRSAAMSMVLNIRQSFRWFPSEHNPSDAPSRLYENDTDAVHSGTDKIIFSYSNFGPSASPARVALDAQSTCSSEGAGGASCLSGAAAGADGGSDFAEGGPEVYDLASDDREDALSSDSAEGVGAICNELGSDFEYVHPGLRQMFRPEEDRPRYPDAGSHKRQTEIEQGLRGPQRHHFRGGRSRRRLKYERRWRSDEVAEEDLREAPARAGAILRPGTGWLIFGKGRPQFPRADGGAAWLAGDVREGDPGVPFN